MHYQFVVWWRLEIRGFSQQRGSWRYGLLCIIKRTESRDQYMIHTNKNLFNIIILNSYPNITWFYDAKYYWYKYDLYFLVYKKLFSLFIITVTWIKNSQKPVCSCYAIKSYKPGRKTSKNGVSQILLSICIFLLPYKTIILNSGTFH